MDVSHSRSVVGELSWAAPTTYVRRIVF